TTLVHTAIEEAQATATDRRVEWVLPAHWPVVRGDGALLAKLLGHVLSNALKYTSKRTDARIELGWREAEPADPQPSGFDHPQTMVKLWIKDNGAGFDSDQAQNMYVMFQRQHHTMDFDGTGTGLALSQRIVGLHRGTFRISSQCDRGCQVNITLPLINTPEAD
ncbi:MAG: hypothetical protein K2W33_03955, partial [Burkholderiales bacterium]|nr:hypothetical protein [Burkholderiales bacterium]